MGPRAFLLFGALFGLVLSRARVTDLASGFTAARALSDALHHALEWSRDVDEGMAAHREGRQPRFTGR